MTDADVAEAIASVDGLRSLMLEGKTLQSDVAGVMTGASIERTIEGASTLTLSLFDERRVLLRSGLFSSRLTAQVDDLSFELVKVRKSGDVVTVVFEDLAVAALRRHNTPRKVAPNTMTHVEFARSLVAEEPWVSFRPPQKLGPQPKAKVEMARGTPEEPGEEAEREDTWAAIGRLADERGWRRFMRGGDLWYMPEPYLFERPVEYQLREHGLGGVDEIDFDFDIGKPVATASVTARSGRWTVPVGSLVEIVDLGPASGKWLVNSVSRSLFDLPMSIDLAKPRPVLPEPEPPPAPTAEELGPQEGGTTRAVFRLNPGDPVPAPGGGSGQPGPSSSQGFQWPLRGRVSSGFGPRGGRLHAGIDIAVPVGTAIGAAKAGTVVFAGSAGGYGYAVYIDHGGVITRYGHLSRIEARRGQRVSRGQRIGLSGGARGARGSGNSRGPHLHFEVRPGNRPANPMKYLP